MRIAFRTDASIQIGTGHVMRCLTLADHLRERGAQCTFICRPHAGHLLDFIARRGHETASLSPLSADAAGAPDHPPHAAWLGTDWASDAAETRQILKQTVWDWLVVDHYALDRQWEQALSPCVQQLMVIDDLADRPHDCQLLLDQNLGRAKQDYDGLLNSGTQILIGPQYALLRPEFAKLRPASLARRKQPRLQQLLITMGGIDKDNATGRALEALGQCQLPSQLRITVVMGANAPFLESVKAQAEKMSYKTQVLVGVSNMAELMASSDLAIGAVGSTSWERCCMGLPTLMQVLADNQRTASNWLASAGAGITIDESSPLQPQLQQMIEAISSSPAVFEEFVLNAARITEGEGVNLTSAYLA